jgi:hypothetical protein
MRDDYVHSQGAEGANSADAQEDLLAYASLGIASVKSGSNGSILGGVLFDIRIEEKKGGTTDRHFPNLRHHGPARHLYGN